MPICTLIQSLCRICEPQLKILSPVIFLKTHYQLYGTLAHIHSFPFSLRKLMAEWEKINLIIHGNIAEEVSHRLPIVDATDSFRKDQADIHSLYLGTLQFLYFMRNCIGDHNLSKYSKRKRHQKTWLEYLFRIHPWKILSKKKIKLAALWNYYWETDYLCM